MVTTLSNKFAWVQLPEYVSKEMFSEQGHLGGSVL